MSKSIVQNNKSDFLSGSEKRQLHKHHCLTGGLRNFAESEGLYIYLEPETHMRLHNTPRFETEIKQIAQLIYENTHTRKSWMSKVRKNYLATLTENQKEELLNKYHIGLNVYEYDISKDPMWKT